MKSQKGSALLSLVFIVLVLIFLAAVAVYLLIGPNGVLNEEIDEDTNTVEVVTPSGEENVVTM